MDVSIPQSLSSGTPLLAAAWIALGLLACFVGYRLFRGLLAIYGLGVGAYLGSLAAARWFEGHELVGMGVTVVAALIGAGLMMALYRLGVFVVGAVAGVLLVKVAVAGLGLDLGLGAVLVGAVALGVLALLFQRTFLILATACSGSWAATTGAVALLLGQDLGIQDMLRRPPSWQDAGIPPYLYLLVWLALAGAGALSQFRTRTK